MVATKNKTQRFRKINKISFSRLVHIIYSEEKEVIEEAMVEEPLKLKEDLDNLKSEIGQVNSLDSLLNFLEGQGHSTTEAYELIINHLVKLPEEK
jgi:hypothetical protein